jgi:hypothetical protein
MGNQAYKARQRAKGLCRSCSNPVVDGLINCEYHAKQDRIRRLKRAYVWRENRCCMNCGLELDDYEKSVCTNCTVYHSRYIMERGKR